MKIIIKILAFSSFLLSNLYANEHEAFQLRYLKVGTELGLGYRMHEEFHGYDLSLNATSLIFHNWFSAKGLYMNYPFYEHDRFFYWGLGAGVTHKIELSIYAHSDQHLTYPSFESVIGYEFNPREKVKMFLQFEASVPITRREEWPIIPQVTFGIGF